MLDFVSLFKNIPSEIATVLIAMVPIGEIRAALPIALTVYKQPFWLAYLLGVLGNMIPIVLILRLLQPFSEFLMKRSKIAVKFFEWFFQRTHRKNKKSFEKWGILALVIFIAIPLPLTGGWSGSVAAFVFGIPFKKALLANLIGVSIAGLIVGAMTIGLKSIF